jgi:hypothetical protein
MMMKGFREALPADYEVRLLELELTLPEAITLASIVEREARIPADRPVIASVFLNRLEKGMKLESCATVMYALGGWKERLLFSDTRVESPYNTYVHAGLPPAPICSRPPLRAVFRRPPRSFISWRRATAALLEDLRRPPEAIRQVRGRGGNRSTRFLPGCQRGTLSLEYPRAPIPAGSRNR